MCKNEVSLHPYAIARCLALVAGILILFNIKVHLFAAYYTDYHSFYGLIKLFNLDSEYNIPTWFSVLLLLTSSLLLLLIAYVHKQKEGQYVFYWYLLECGFLIMAIDEAWQIHEKLIHPVQNLIGGDNFVIFYYAWVIPGILVVIVLALVFLRFLFSLPTRFRIYFLLATAFYLGGAIGIELLGGFYAERHGMYNLTYGLIITLEESLEMTGLIIFIWALLEYMANSFGQIKATFIK